MQMNRDSYQKMLTAVQAFHDKHRFKDTGGEEMTYRIALMAEELGEIAECVTKGKSKEQLAEECADLFILLIGTAIAADSVAVNQPKILPPMMITGVIIAGIATNIAASTSLNVERGYLG